MTKTMIVEGMTCEHCKKRVESAIDALSGATASVDLESKKVTVTMGTEISDETLVSTVTEAGYTVVSIG